MSKTKEITLLTKPGLEIMEYNGYVNFISINSNAVVALEKTAPVIMIYNKEYFN